MRKTAKFLALSFSLWTKAGDLGSRDRDCIFQESCLLYLERRRFNRHRYSSTKASFYVLSGARGTGKGWGASRSRDRPVLSPRNSQSLKVTQLESFSRIL